MNYGTVNPYYGASAMNYYDPYLQHFGVKGMKWGQHIFGPLQSAWKYAMGENTLGYAKAAAARAKEAKGYEKEVANLNKQMANGPVNSKGFYDRLNAAQSNAAIKRKASESYKRHAIESFKKGAIYRGASAVAGMASGAAKRVYGAAGTVGKFIRTNGKKLLGRVGLLAGKFKNMITGRTKQARNTINTVNAQLERKRNAQAARDTMSRISTGVAAGRQRAAARNAKKKKMMNMGN